MGAMYTALRAPGTKEPFCFMFRIIWTRANSKITVLPLPVGEERRMEDDFNKTCWSNWHCMPLNEGKEKSAAMSGSLITVDTGRVVRCAIN